MTLTTLSTHTLPEFGASTDGIFLRKLHEVGFRLTKIDPMTSAFIHFAISQKAWVLDVGCGFGIATIPVIMSGGYVMAHDLEENHLESIKKKIQPHYHEHLRLIKAVFPDDMQLAENSLAAILISRLFPFLSEPKIDQALALSYKWLKPGGRIFIGGKTLITDRLVNLGFLEVQDSFSTTEKGIIAQKLD